MPAPKLRYDEIELRVEVRHQSRIVQASSGGADARAAFALPPIDRGRIEQLVTAAIIPRRRRMESTELTDITTLGRSMFEALFSQGVRDLYHQSRARADAAGRGLRINLSLVEAPDLTTLPWELMHDGTGFLALDRMTPVVRSLDMPQIWSVPDIHPPLRILGVVSSPKGVAQLDVEQERLNVEKALHHLVSDRLIELRWLERATLSELLAALRQDDFHIFHFIGHGQFDEQSDDGALFLEDDEGFARKVSSRRLGQVLRGHGSLGLAVINACETGRSAADDPFAGIAGSLLQQGIPAVIAMQFAITDSAAISFSRDLYDALAKQHPIDAAVCEARKAVWAEDNDVEWATPVLFLRARHGELFHVLPQQREQLAPSQSLVEPLAEPPAQPPTQPPTPARQPRPVRRLSALLATAGLVAALIVGGSFAVLRGLGRDHWERLPNLPHPLEAAGMTAWDGRIWLAGGVGPEQGRPRLSSVSVYDPGTRTWRAGPELPVALDHASLISTGERLYLLGGIGDAGSVATVYRLDSPTGRWIADDPLPAARGAGAAAWDGDRMVFAGGVGLDKRAADDVWARQEGGAWQPLGHLQRAREKLAATTDGYGTVWFMAGRDPDSQTNAFSEVDVVMARTVRPDREVAAVQGPQAVIIPGAGPCILGGQSASDFSGALDCRSGRTPPVPTLVPGRAGLGAVVLDNRLYVAGGYGPGLDGTARFESVELPEVDGNS